MTISEKILSMSSTMSKKQNLLGKFILDNIYDVTLMNALQIARGAGVSEATLTRFVCALGFNSFSDFLLALRKETINSKGVQFRQEPYLDDDDQVYRKVFDVEIDLMKETLNNIDPASFGKAVDMLLECDRLLVVGGPLHHYIASYAANFICAYRDNVHVIRQVDMDFVSQLRSVGPQSAALIFSYPRYSKEMQRIAEILLEKNVPMIALTDSKLSPVVPLADVTLLTPKKYIVLADASASSMTMIHALIVAMYRKHPDKIKEKLEEYERDVRAADLFVYKDYNFVKGL